MNINEIIFTDSFPSIDLHGLDRDTARVKVLEFINDNKVLRNSFICIIHGIGNGILKGEVHNTLRKNKDVLDFKLLYNNIGCTIVKVKID